MKGDYTRFTHAPRKHYTRVLRQQGRVDLDADWNEQVEIERHLERTTTRDVVGPSGAPAEASGFRISVSPGGGDLAVSCGRMYVDGILCENESNAVTYLSQPDYPDPPALAPEAGRRDLLYLDVWERHVTALEDPDVREVALGGPDTANRVKTVWQVKVRRGVDELACDGVIPGWDDVTRPSGGRLSTDVTREAASDDPCILPPGGGYRGLENRLYRVEVHDAGDVGVARFKWSRDNGSVVFPITEIAPAGASTLRLQRLGRDKVLAVRPGDWVEVLDDAAELREEPGTMARVLDVRDEERIVELDRPVPSTYTLGRHARVRRWDQQEDVDADGLLATAAGPIELEDGVLVSFGGSGLRAGDHWAFAARTATREVERLAAEPPRGVRHHYAPLAVVEWTGMASGADMWAVLRAFAAWLSTSAEDPDLREQGRQIALWIEEKAKDLSPDEMVDAAFEALSRESVREQVGDFAAGLVAAVTSPEAAARVRSLVADLFDLAASRPDLAKRVADAVVSLFASATGPEIAGKAEETLDAAFAWLAEAETRESVQKFAADIEEQGSPELASFLRWLHESLLRPEVQGGIRTVLRGLFEQAERPDVQATIGEWVEKGIAFAVGPETKARALAATDGLFEAASRPEVQERAAQLAKRLYGMVLDSPARDWAKALARRLARQASGDLPERMMEGGFEFASGPWVRKAAGWVEDRKGGPEVRDLRRVFTPLTTLASGCCVATVGDGKRSFGRFTDIQAAVDAVECGGTVCVLPGTYVLADTVIVARDDVTICGCGGLALVQAPAGKPAFLVRRARRVTLCELRVEATAEDAAVVVRDSQDVAVEECAIRNRAARPAPQDEVVGVKALVRAPVDAAVPVGPAVRVLDSEDVRVRGNETFATALTITEGDGAGVARSVEIEGNRAVGGGVRIRDGSVDVSVRANDISKGEGDGVSLGGPGGGAVGVAGVVIADNVVSDMGGSGVATAASRRDGKRGGRGGGARRLVIEGNRIVGCARTAPDPERGPAAIGGIVLQDASEVRIQDNRIEGNEGARSAFACGVYAYRCASVEVLGNTITGNGAAAGADAQQGVPGGIVAVYVVSGGATQESGQRLRLPRRTGEPALRVHDNVVVCPRGPALLVVTIGPTSIQANSLTSHGLADFAAPDMAMRENERPGVVSVYAVGQGPSGSNEGFALADGRLLFQGNQVALLVDEPARDQAIPAAATFVSPDEVLLADNQFLAEAPQAFVNVHVHAQSERGLVRATGNRFTELPRRAGYSYQSVAAWNVAVGNQAMHCIDVKGANVNAGLNQVMIPDNCGQRPAPTKEAPG